MMWLVGLIFLVFLFHRSTATATAKELRVKLSQKGCLPELYTFSRLQRVNAVYAKIMMPPFKNGFAQFHSQQSIIYIGSTRLKPAHREFNRLAKIQQLQNGALPKVEVVFRYWVDNANYGRLITLALSGHSGYRDAWAAEHATIQAWQARLNHPFISKFLVKKAHGLVPARQRQSMQPGNDTLGIKLFKKMRRRLHHQRSPEAQLLPQLPQLWEFLYDLSSDTLKEFEASKILRSGRYPSEIALVLFRLANHLEQPWRSKCTVRLKLILQFRNQSIPKKNRPLKMTFLAHEGFRVQLRQFLHQEVRRAQAVLIPYHLPTAKQVEASPTKVIRLLWSDVKDLPPPSSTCSCADFLRKHPKADSIDGHVVTGLETLTLPHSLRHFQDMGGANAYFDNKVKFMERSIQAMDKWMQHHQFPRYTGTKQRFRQFLNLQWQQHSQSLKRNPRHTVGGIKYLKNLIPADFVVRNGGHANNHIVICCSQLYNRATVNSWSDPGVFTELNENPEQLKRTVEQRIPTPLTKQQLRLVDFSKDLPYGYIMMKRKKQWNKGRTIVAYGSTCVGKILKLAALAIQELLNSTWPCHFGNRLTPGIWRDIHQFIL